MFITLLSCIDTVRPILGLPRDARAFLMNSYVIHSVMCSFLYFHFEFTYQNLKKHLKSFLGSYKPSFLMIINVSISHIALI